MPKEMEPMPPEPMPPDPVDAVLPRQIARVEDGDGDWDGDPESSTSRRHVGSIGAGGIMAAVQQAIIIM
jgi:hypothetical protein